MNKLINGRTPEEIKRGIRCHVCWGDCSTECPYDDVRNKPAHECIQSMTKDALDLIKHLEAKQSKWIKVEERLPEKPGTYVAYALGMHLVLEFDENEDWWDEEYNRYNVSITHWMPLPEPPEEVE